MSTVNSWHVIGATILGVIGAAGMFIIEHYRQERRRHVLSQDLARIDRQMSLMKVELDQLRQLQTRNKNERTKKGKKRSNSFLSTTTSSTEDYRSVVDGDSSDQEFYDLSDEESLNKPKDLEVTDFKKIDSDLDSGKTEIIKESLVFMQNYIAEHPEAVQLLWRIGKAYYHIAMTSTDPNIKQEQINKGIEYCQNALEVNPNIAEIHKWYAILIGSRSDFQSMKERIADGHLFKKHIDKAIELNPSDPSLHHLLGRFAYEVSGLKWYERKAAAALFGEPPNATYEEALNHFLQAEHLSQKEWKENKMLIGKCHIANGDYQSGVDWLAQANGVKCKDEIEEQFDVEIKTLLAKYNTYIR